MSESLPLSPEELQTLRDLLNFGRALTDSVSSASIVRMASTVGELAGILEALQRQEVVRLLKVIAESADDLAGLVQLASEYQASGALKVVMELAALLSALKDAVATPTVARMAENLATGMVAGDRLLANLGGFDRIQSLAKAAQEAAREAEADPRKIGIGTLLKSLKEPQVQKGIKFLLHFLSKLA